MDNKEEFKKIWDIFNNLILKSDKLKTKTFYEFAKVYVEKNEQFISSESSNPIKNLERKIRRWEESYKDGRKQQRNTINELKEYCNFLEVKVFKHELLEDEDIEHWFD